jgi:basic membrane protein A and related proteins
MKRALRLLAVVSVVGLVAAACSKNTTTTPGASASGGGQAQHFKIGMVYDLAGRGDHSFNDSAYEGLQRAAKDFPNIEVKDLTPVSSGKNRQPLMRLLASTGYQLIFGNGFAFQDDLSAVAKDYPNLDFACTDCGVATQSNVLNLNFDAPGGEFLAGSAAALKSKTGKIGFMGGVETPLIKQFLAGFQAGVKFKNPSATVDVKYLTVAPDFTGFSDPGKGHEAALGMFQAGDDIVAHAAGGSGDGLFKAAEEYSKANNTHVWAIGVDGDQYQSAPADEQPYILTSMIKNVGTAVYDTIKAFINGQFEPGTKVWGLDNGGIALATSGGFIDDIKPQLDDIEAKIENGTIKVPTA